MVNYRRSQALEGTFFFTVNLRDRSAHDLITHINHLRQDFHQAQQQRPYKIIASVILPEHLHVIMKLPDNDADFLARWKAIKSNFSRALWLCSTCA